MNFIDIIIIAIVAVAFILGFKDGFVRKLIGTIGFFIAVFLAIYFADESGALLYSMTGIEEYLANIIGGFLIFVISIVVVSIIKRLVHPFDKVNNLINQIIGGLVGAIQFLFFLSALFYLTSIFNFPDDKDRTDSLFYNHVSNIIPATFDYLNEKAPKAKEFIKEKIMEHDSL